MTSATSPAERRVETPVSAPPRIEANTTPLESPANGGRYGLRAYQSSPKTIRRAPEARIQAASIPKAWRKDASHPSGSIEDRRDDAKGIVPTIVRATGAVEEPSEDGTRAALRAARNARIAALLDILVLTFHVRFSRRLADSQGTRGRALRPFLCAQAPAARTAWRDGDVGGCRGR